MAKKTPASQGNQYEAMFLLGSQAANDLDAGMKTVRGMIEKHGGQIIVLKKWDERKLAYEVKRNKRGTYIIAYFKAPGAAIAPIEREVNLSEEVLRVLVSGADHLNEKEMNAVEPQPIQPREERAPWDRPGFNNDGGFRPDRGDRGERAPRREEPAGAAKE
jgi:small subunit ribosomal protein S6